MPTSNDGGAHAPAFHFLDHRSLLAAYEPGIAEAVHDRQRACSSVPGNGDNYLHGKGGDMIGAQ
jgi:hypothetical protein